MVAVSVPLAKAVRVTEPLRSPAKVIVGDLLIVVPDEMSPPLISTVFKTGAVSVLLVSVCDPESVVTVLSIAKVTVLPLPVVSIPVPPVKVIVSLSKSILKAPPESP